MRFFISRASNLVAIDNVALKMDCSALPSNIRYVIWNESNSGFVEYNTGIALRVPFSDPSPYLGVIAEWLNIQAIATPALTLAQAQSLQAAFVEILFAVKRQLPLPCAVGAGSFTWDASDQGIAALTTASNGPAMLWQGIVTGFNTWIGSLTVAPSSSPASLNQAFYGTINGVGQSLGSGDWQIPTLTVGGGSADVAALVSLINTWIAGGLQSTFNTIESNPSFTPPTVPQISGSAPPSVAPVLALINTWITQQLNPAIVLAMSVVNANVPIAPIVGLPTISVSWIPLGQTSPVTLTPVDIAEILSALAVRTGNLQATRLIKEAAIAALLTVADVIAYDVNAGW